jgi:hypothetical protein
MRTLLPSLIALLLVTCARSPVSHPPPHQYDESIRFPKALESPGLRLGRSEQRVRMDGAIVQAMMTAAQDFIPPHSEKFPCWTKPADFLFDVIREGDIIFVAISPDYFAQGCELEPAPMDWGAKYAISTAGRILRRMDDAEPDGTSPPSSPDAGANEDAGYSRRYDLSDLDRMDTAPVENPPFFTRPEWQAQHPWPPSRKPRTPSLPGGGTPDGGTPDGGVHADGGSPAVPPM